MAVMPAIVIIVLDFQFLGRVHHPPKVTNVAIDQPWDIGCNFLVSELTGGRPNFFRIWILSSSSLEI
jgi:hypothetical protein